MKNAESQIDEFKTWCRVKADISKDPYTTNHATMDRRRECDMVLLMDLPKRKAQVCWIDPRTVCGRLVPDAFPYLIRLSALSRSDAVVVCVGPSEGT